MVMARISMSGGAKAKKPVPAAKRTGDAKPANRIRVSQATIDTIKKQGMTAALKKAGSGGVSKEYMEGVKRMYGAKRIASATGAAVNKRQTASKPAAKSADAARAAYNKANPAPKKIGTKPPVGKLPYYYTEAEKAYVKAYGKPKNNSKPTPKQKPTKQQIAYGKSRAGGK
jgi:hypothetical protein